MKHTRAAAILVSSLFSRPADQRRWFRRNPYLDFARALALFYQPPKPAPGIHPLASVAATAQIGEGASIGPFAVVGEHVTHRTQRRAASARGDLRRRADRRRFSGALARRGAGVLPHRPSRHPAEQRGDRRRRFRLRQTRRRHALTRSSSRGVTVIEDDVEIQSLTSIDRATIGETRVKRGAKIDSLVQVGHACVVGEDNIICAQTGLAGSSFWNATCCWRDRWAFPGHLTIHDDAIVYAQSGVGRDVPAGARMSGSPAFAASEWLRAITAFPKLAEIAEDRTRVEKESRENRKDGRAEKRLHGRPPLAYRNREFLNIRMRGRCASSREYLEPLTHFRHAQDPRHGRVLRLGATYSRTARWATITRTRGRSPA